ncbi:MAG: acetyl-CoA carboxylase biotin carboxyl carrier protein [Lachnospirales bacterium]
MNYNEVIDLLKFVEKSNFNDFEIDFQGAKIKLSKNFTEREDVQPEQIMQVVNEPIKPVPTKITKEVIKENENKIDLDSPITIMPTEYKEDSGTVVKSPIVGTFYNSSSPESPVFVKVGDVIKKGDVLCIVEAMKVMNEITSVYDGKIVKILVNNEDLVEYDQPLFVIEEN